MSVVFHAPFECHGGLDNQSLDWLIREAEHRCLSLDDLYGSAHAKRIRLAVLISKDVDAKSGNKTPPSVEDQKPKDTS